MESTLELRGECSQNPPIETFTFLGELFRGDYNKLIDQYALSNPSAKFRIWLIDRDLRIEVGTNIFQDKRAVVDVLKKSKKDFRLITKGYEKHPTLILIESLLKEIEK